MNILCPIVIVDSRHILRNGIIIQTDDLTVLSVTAMEERQTETYATTHINGIASAEPPAGTNITLPHPDNIFHPDNIALLASACPPITIGRPCRLRIWQSKKDK